MEEYWLIALAFFVVATLYSSVGFGGGSSYLAILTLVLGSFYAIRSTALLCNVVVVGNSCLVLYLSGRLAIKKYVPFILASIPMAFVGALLKLEEHIFFILLGAALILSALLLGFQTMKKRTSQSNYAFPPKGDYLLGGSIGFLSGLVGIGGGIFLAPVLNLLKWAQPLTIAGLASFYILVNSLAGLAGLFIAGTFEADWTFTGMLLVAVFLGGQLGIRLSLGKLGAKGIRMITAVLVLFVGFKVLLQEGFNFSFEF